MSEEKPVVVAGLAIKINPNIMKVDTLYRFKFDGQNYCAYKRRTGETIILELQEK